MLFSVDLNLTIMILITYTSRKKTKLFKCIEFVKSGQPNFFLWIIVLYGWGTGKKQVDGCGKMQFYLARKGRLDIFIGCGVENESKK